MCLEKTYSTITKYPETFFDVLKTDQNEKSCATIWKFLKPNSTSRLMPCLHKKTLSCWQMDWSLDKIAYTVIGKYLYTLYKG